MTTTITKSYIGHNWSNNTPIFTGRTANANTYFQFKNRIINGDFSINQISGTITATNVSTRYFTIDRWWTQGTQASKFTTQIINDGPFPANTYYGSLGSGDRRTSYYNPIHLTKCVEIKSSAATTIGSTDTYSFGQNIEGRHISDMCFGESTFGTLYFVLSFWVKASTTGYYTYRFLNAANNRVLHRTYVVNTANVWEYKEAVIPVDQSGTWSKGIDTGLRLIFNLGIGSSYKGTTGLGSWASSSPHLSDTLSTELVSTANATLRLTGIQLEFIGSSQDTSQIYASPFERRGFSTELDLCMRYFQKSWAYSTNPGTQTIAGMLLYTDMQYSNIQHYNFWKWPGGPMRAAPTVQVYGYNSPGQAGLCYLWGASINGLGDYSGASAGVSRYGAMFYTPSSVYHALEGFHFKADAEPT